MISGIRSWIYFVTHSYFNRKPEILFIGQGNCQAKFIFFFHHGSFALGCKFCRCLVSVNENEEYQKSLLTSQCWVMTQYDRRVTPCCWTMTLQCWALTPLCWVRTPSCQWHCRVWTQQCQCQLGFLYFTLDSTLNEHWIWLYNLMLAAIYTNILECKGGGAFGIKNRGWKSFETVTLNK